MDRTGTETQTGTRKDGRKDGQKEHRVLTGRVQTAWSPYRESPDKKGGKHTGDSEIWDRQTGAGRGVRGAAG